MRSCLVSSAMVLGAALCGRQPGAALQSAPAATASTTPAVTLQAPLVGIFQEPTKAELQMTADDKAPGAAAVCLDREDVTEQARKTRWLYERIKVLAEKGKELSTIQVDYEPGRDKVEVEGRTIHADGSIVPLTEPPNDLVDFKTQGYQQNTLVFTLPSVEVGSILEYRVTVQSTQFADQIEWKIQQPYFVHQEHYSYRDIGNTRMGYIARMPKGDKVVLDSTGAYTLDLTNVAALPEEDWMPPLNTLEWRVTFFDSRYSTAESFWSAAQENWGNSILEFIKPTGTLKKAVQGMIASSDTETQKAKKIYAAVVKLENTDFTREKTRAEQKKAKVKDIREVQDVWKAQGGNSNEIALLFIALCRAAGLDVGAMKVVDRSRALFDKSLLNSRQLDDFIAVGRLDGKEVYFDPGEKVCPFGMLSWRHMQATGFRLDGTTVRISRTPPLSIGLPSIMRVADLTIDESGGVKGVVRVVLNGQEALHWRQVALKNDEEEVKKQFNEWMNESLPEGVQLEFGHFMGLDDYESNLIGVVQITGSLGTVTGRRMFLPGLFFEAKAKHPFVAEEKRVTPVDLRYARAESDDVTYRLPAIYKVESSPQKSSFSWPDHAELEIATQPLGDGLTVTRSFSRSFAVLDSKDYEDLRKFYVKVAEADQQQVVLVKTPAKDN